MEGIATITIVVFLDHKQRLDDVYVYWFNCSPYLSTVLKTEKPRIITTI